MKRLELGDLLSDGFKYSTTPYSRAVVLGVLYLLSFLIIPIFLALGYVYRCIKETIDGVERLPEYRDWSRMFVDGLKLFVAYLVIVIPITLIALLIGVPIRLGAIFNPYAMMMSMLSIYAASIIIGILLGLYLFMAIPYMIYVGQISSIFSFGEVLKRIEKIGYGNYLAICIVTLILVWLLSLVSFLIPVIGVIFVMPIATLLLARIQGSVFKSTIS
ncbi:MAG: hypothetical protein DRN68_01655 [Thaumarchaeota archaeon]|nr:MAG: hypothetical protein DRN68_01655 [Nitrososphaerota archaeon]